MQESGVNSLDLRLCGSHGPLSKDGMIANSMIIPRIRQA